MNTVLLKSDGNAVVFGPVSVKNPLRIPDLPSHVIYTQASLGGHHLVLLRSDGRVVAIGSNTDGQCNIPQAMRSRCCIQVAAGDIHTALLMKDGTAIAFGSNLDRQCDLPRELPHGVNGYTQIAAGFVNTVLLQSDGMAVVCGHNKDGQANIPALPEGMRYSECGVPPWCAVQHYL